MHIEENLKYFSGTLKELRTKNQLTQKELGMLLGQTEESAQPYVAKLEKGAALKPKLEDLLTLSEHFNVSVDYLLGRQTTTGETASISPRSICEFILKLANKNVFFHTITVNEKCLYQTRDILGDEGIVEDDRENKYIAIYFSNWWKPENREDIDIFNQVGNDCSESKEINHFLCRLTQIAKMKLNGDLDEEMYNILLDNYLMKVSDTPYYDAKSHQP